jgi:hypothetical protein
MYSFWHVKIHDKQTFHCTTVLAVYAPTIHLSVLWLRAFDYPFGNLDVYKDRSSFLLVLSNNSAGLIIYQQPSMPMDVTKWNYLRKKRINLTCLFHDEFSVKWIVGAYTARTVVQWKVCYDLQSTTHKTKIEQQEPHKTPGMGTGTHKR